MAVPSSGQLREYADIGVELGVAQSNVSLRGMSQTAGFSAPDAMSEFYGYSSMTPTDHYDTISYTGNGVDPTNITGLSFKPSIVFISTVNINGWPKYWFYEKDLNSIWKLETTGRNPAQNASTDDEMRSFNSNGFTVGDDTQVNSNGLPYVAYCFRAGSSFVTNSNGSISSYVSANTAAGFSIARYTGTAVAGSVGHGLDSTPDLIITKSEQRSEWWGVQTSISGVWQYGATRGDLASTEVSKDGTNTVTSANSSSFSIGTHADINLNSYGYVSYCFHNVNGYQKVGTYVGNGVSRNIDTGFQARFIWIKSGAKTGDSVGDWHMFSSEIGFNLINLTNNNNWVNSSIVISNSSGFRLNNGSSLNESGKTFLYLAIA